MLALLQEIDAQPYFSPIELLDGDTSSLEEAANYALWDVVYVRLSALQEYGWHAGLEELCWVGDTVREGLAEMSWPHVQRDLGRLRDSWVELIIRHASEHKSFFPPPSDDSEDYRFEE